MAMGADATAVRSAGTAVTLQQRRRWRRTNRSACITRASLLPGCHRADP